MNVSRLNFACDMVTAKIILALGCAVYLLLLPVFLSVALVGYKKWKKQRSVSYCDTITYHMVALEMMSVVGTYFFCYGIYVGDDYLRDIGIVITNATAIGQLLFHCLTCGERYLAAVHPITYLRWKKRGGVTIWISIVFTWLCAMSQIVIRLKLPLMSYLILASVQSVCAFAIVTFCSVSVLRVLIGPRPGDGGGDARRVDRSKRAACNTMLVILGALLMRFTVLLINYMLTLAPSIAIDKCVMRVTVPWFELPSCLVLPLLFLHREGKLWMICRPCVISSER